MGGIRVEGTCEPRFARVREVFAASFEKGEVGAAVAVYLEGRPVVDLWGGHADPERTRPWTRDTIVNVYSTTKGMTALCANRLVDQGKLDLDAPVARYWPEFARVGKDAIPVRWLLTHQAGLPALSGTVSCENCYEWSFMTRALEAQEPWWEPGTKHGYHALTFGYLVGELVRRVDGRTLGAYFRAEVARPLGLDFWIGLPDSEHARSADVIPAPPSPPGVLDPFAAAAAQPDSLVGRVFANPVLPVRAVNSAPWRRAEMPAVNGHGTARALARAYAALALGGRLDGVSLLSRAQIERACAAQVDGPDQVLSIPTRFGLGFMLPQPAMPFAPGPRVFGHPGAGGSLAFADPDAGLGFAYVMNQMQMALAGDARGFALVQQVYEAMQ